jgi:hypothetical protein
MSAPTPLALDVLSALRQKVAFTPSPAIAQAVMGQASGQGPPIDPGAAMAQGGMPPGGPPPGGGGPPNRLFNQ